MSDLSRPLTMVIAALLLQVLAAEDRLIDDADAATAWSGGTCDEAMRHQGTASLRWDPAAQPRLALAITSGVLAQAPALHCWMHCARDSRSRLTVTIAHAAQTADTFHAELALSWTGWRRITMPRAAFTRDGHADWRKADRIAFALTTADGTPPIIHLDEVGVGDPVGPALADAQLLDQFACDRPALASVKARMAANDLSGAMTELMRYYRKRPAVPWLFAAEDGERGGQTRSPQADQVVAGRIVAGNVLYQVPGGGGHVDWHLNPTLGKANETPEYTYSLNRLGMWESLGRGWELTHEPAYAETFVAQLRSWSHTVPAPSIMEEHPASCWRPLEASLRAGQALPAAWIRFIQAPAFSDEDVVLMLKLFADHGRYLDDYASRGGNHLINEQVGLYALSVLMPEFRDATRWRQHALDRLMPCLRAGFLADGAWLERSTGYHGWVVDKCLDLYRLARLNHLDQELPSDYLPMLSRAAAWKASLCTPNGSAPMINDTTQQDVVGESAELARLLPDPPPVLRWVAGLGKEQRQGKPPFTSIGLMESGFLILRSGWNRDDTLACLDTGALGGWHGHQAKLGLILHGHGRELLFDSGGGTYDKSAFRAYAKSTRSHSTVLVDGQDQARSWSDEDPQGRGDPRTPAAIFVTRDQWDYACGWYQDGYGRPDSTSASHRREVGFVKPDHLIVVDTLIPRDDQEHRYEARWQLKTTAWAVDPSTSATSTTDAGQANCAIIPLEADHLTVQHDSGARTPELLGWDVERRNGQAREPRPALTVRHQRAGRGVQRFVTLLRVLPPGQGTPACTIDHMAADTWTLVDAGHRITITTSADHRPGMTVVITDPRSGSHSLTLAPP